MSFFRSPRSAADQLAPAPEPHRFRVTIHLVDPDVFLRLEGNTPTALRTLRSWISESISNCRTLADAEDSRPVARTYGLDELSGGLYAAVINGHRVASSGLRSSLEDDLVVAISEHSKEQVAIRGSAAILPGGGAVLLVGPRKCGKTRLLAELQTCGYGWLAAADRIVLIGDRSTPAVQGHPIVAVVETRWCQGAGLILRSYPELRHALQQRWKSVHQSAVLARMLSRAQLLSIQHSDGHLAAVWVAGALMPRMSGALRMVS